MPITVLIPSRLQRLPTGSEYWLERALASAIGQSRQVETEIVVGLDAGVRLPTSIRRRFPLVRAAAAGHSTAAALNAAAAASAGDIVAVLEDDDVWAACKLELQLPWLDRAALVTCNQVEIDVAGASVGINDLPTASGWLMRRTTLVELGGFDEGFSYRWDGAFIGKVNRARLPRVHLVEARASTRPSANNTLAYVGRHSDVVETSEADPLVRKVVNPDGRNAELEQVGRAGAQTMLENMELMETFGELPW